jgi:hypothetical protein
MERTMRFGRIECTAAAVAIAFAGTVNADLVEFRIKSDWEAAVGSFTTLDFTGFEDTEVMFDQYAHLGVTFTDGNDQARLGPTVFPNDEWGVVSQGSSPIRFEFSTPQRWLAADYPGGLTYRLFLDDEIIGEADFLTSGVGNFAGIISDVEFDRVEIWDITGGVVLADDIYFGVPTPGVLAALIASSVLFGSRKRDS